MKPLGIFTIVITTLMLISFTISGMFFFNSGIFDFGQGEVTEEKSLTFLVQFENFQENKFGNDGNIVEEAAYYDQHCFSDSNCTWFSSHCGNCNQIPINKEYVSMYKNAVTAACKEQPSQVMCDMAIYPVKCINNMCQLVEE